MARITQERIEALFKATPLLDSLSDTEISKLASSARVLHFGTGATIFSKGEPGSHGYWLVKGRIRLTATTRHGGELLLGMVEPGGQCGEISAIEGGPRSSTAIAETACDCVAVDRESLMSAIEGSHVTMMKVIGMLANYIREAVSTIEMLGLHSSEIRIWYRLMDLARRYNKNPSDTGPLRIEHGHSQKSLAESVGITRVMVNRQLSIWRDLGYIEYERGVTVIHDPNEFEAYVWREPKPG